MRRCEQGCGQHATVYAIDPIPNGWGGYYCSACVKLLRFRIVDRVEPEDHWFDATAERWLHGEAGLES